MSDPRIRLVLPRKHVRADTPRRPLGRLLVEAGLVSATDLMATLGTQQHADAQLGHLLVAQGLITERDVYRTLAEQREAQFVTLTSAPPDFSLQAGLEPLDWLYLQAIPWRKLGNATLVATADPDRFDEVVALLPAHMHPAVMAIVPKSDLERVVRMASATRLAARAETRVPEALSCRALPRKLRTVGATTVVSIALCLATGWLSLGTLYASVFYFAVVMVGVGVTLKSAGALLHLLARTPIFARKVDLPEKLPPISLLVALHDEANILSDLIERLALLRYPKELLEIILIIEQNDDTTRAHLDATRLPNWFRVLIVPRGQITTKPRALNYALPFCRGKIVGVYDAEDAPHPDQLRDVVATFAGQPASTGCIQAILDFYNPGDSAIARFFTIEYAAWFRLILPGVARLGFPIPLGGTSVFFRRSALEEQGGWDAHNVTEDADLGIRLARSGYKTVLINSVTLEEANSEIWPWVRQRSRWLKGYLITYCAHMQNPLRLLLDLGLWKFIGFQAFFLSAISQFLLAPLVWSCMALYFGVPHWLEDALPPAQLGVVMIGFIGIWLVSTCVYLVAISGPAHRRHWPWTLGMSVYLTLGTLAIYKGAWEIIVKPFFWDKTDHGKSPHAQRPAVMHTKD